MKLKEGGEAGQLIGARLFGPMTRSSLDACWLAMQLTRPSTPNAHHQTPSHTASTQPNLAPPVRKPAPLLQRSLAHRAAHCSLDWTLDTGLPTCLIEIRECCRQRILISLAPSRGGGHHPALLLLRPTPIPYLTLPTLLYPTTSPTTHHLPTPNCSKHQTSRVSAQPL
ncbi:hypothetical protein K402DRAFT_257079 [Aulographum hederae CBS 113979]|uniref:Uncharacterized protein n=1 Tax=Aulographum hederae CBS 113979 TaxID=1176131 RepID=A0A6G1H8K6_9PEZI|nr:hypothetical protein K402DRAFT_257079 [Aulographum hederae CBS 113979]